MLWDGHVCRLESLKGARARIRETIGVDVREVPVTELRGVPSLPTLQLDQRLETLRDSLLSLATMLGQRYPNIRNYSLHDTVNCPSHSAKPLRTVHIKK